MYVQAAIDTTCFSEAERLIHRLKSIPEITYLEIGTPLISRFGLSAVDLFVPHYDLSHLYVDLKIIDFPVVEILPYQKIGLRKFSVMAFMNDEAFDQLFEHSASNGLGIFVSTMGYPLSLLRSRVLKLFEKGFRNFICHGAGVSSTTAFEDMIARVRILHNLPDINLVAAGGITRANAMHLRALGCTGIIVGRGLWTGDDPSDIVRDILENALA
jgi:3-keto-L-gulonate-6-phosphate decarboxylase